MKKYSLFIGRWQPWHDGHQWLIDQRLNEGKNVCIAIRDVEVNQDQPWTSEVIKNNIETVLYDYIKEGRVKVIVIPDIESVNYGRGVGYEIIEHVPPQTIKEISATKIRAELREDGKL
ncbi:cytidyltransferase [bacterium]|nr:cytidyltransferase [bacterium]